MRYLRCRVNHWCLQCMLHVSEKTVLIFLSRLLMEFSMLKINFLFCLHLLYCLVRDAAFGEIIWHCFYQIGELNYLLKLFFFLFGGLGTDMIEHFHFHSGHGKDVKQVWHEAWGYVHMCVKLHPL